MKEIPIAGPSITKREVGYVTDAAAHAWYKNANLYHDRFEKAYAKYHGVKYAIALPSCTSAIHLSLLALGIKKGDEVIVPDVTWIGSAAPISYVGATPVFADMDPKTWCLSSESFKQCITKKTKAVIPVDVYGSMPDMTKIATIAKKHNIPIIEDAAEAAGAKFKKKKAGTFGLTGVFSFHGTKTLTTGEGGMLITNSKKIYDRVLFLRDHGRQPGDTKFRQQEVAYKYKMSSMQAALGLAQIERIKEIIAFKRKTFGWYKKELKDIEGLTLNYEDRNTLNTFWMVTVILSPKYKLKKEKLQELLLKKKIHTRPFFYPLSSLPAYKNLPQAKLAKKRNKVSYEISPYGINLPSALCLTQKDVKFVCKKLKEILNV